MAKLNQAELDALPLKSFGDPSNRDYYITDQDDVDSAASLIGKADNPDAVKKRIIRIAKRLKLTIPDAWAPKAAAMGAEDMTADDIYSAIMDALGDRYPGTNYGPYIGTAGVWIRDFYPSKNQVIFDYGDDSYRYDYTIDDSGTVTLVGDPVDVVKRTTWVPETEAAEMASFESAEFDLEYVAEFSEDHDFIEYTGKIFEAGHYPKQEITMTAEDIRRACADFAEPIPLKDTHSDHQSIFRGKMGQLVKVWNKGGEVFGTLRVPTWIRQAIGDKKPRVSVEINYKTKRFDNLALLNFPQVRDAEVVAAFAAFEGKRHNKTDAARMQSIHDHCVGLGAVCADENASEVEPDADDGAAAAMGARHSKADASDIQNLHDLSVKQGATCKPSGAKMGAVDPSPNDSASASTTPAIKENRMQKEKETIFDRLKALFGKHPEALADVGISPEEQAAIESGNVAQFAAASEPTAEELAAKAKTEEEDAEAEKAKATANADFESRLAAAEKTAESYRANFAASCAATLSTKANAFADKYCRPQLNLTTNATEVRADPSERENIVALFEMAAIADGDGKTANFGEDSSLRIGANMEKLTKAFDARKPLPYFGVEIPDAHIDPNSDVTGSSKASVDNLLSKSGLGAAALKDRNGAAKFGSDTALATAVAAGVVAALEQTRGKN